MKSIVYLVAAALMASIFASCQTASTQEGPQPIRPQGSGGRGASPGLHAETSSSHM